MYVYKIFKMQCWGVLGSLEDVCMYTHNEHVDIISTQRLTL